MAEQTVYCEECVEDIPVDEVYWDEGRLYCRRCGSEVEAPDRDIFEEIVDNQSALLFRDDEPDDSDDDAEEAAIKPIPDRVGAVIADDSDEDGDEANAAGAPTEEEA